MRPRQTRSDSGKHPKHKGESDPAKLGTVEQFFVEVMDIPRLRERIEAFVFTKTFDSTRAKVEHHLDTLQAACKELSECDDFVKVLEATLAVGNHLNQQGRNGGAAGFKLDTLLRLVDVKGTDRSTSLLHFVIQELLKTAPSVETLPEQMSAIKPASSLQVTAIKTLLEELTTGMNQVNEEILKATCDDGKETHSGFGSIMVSFASRAEEELKALRSRNRSTASELKSIAEFYGESFSEDEPTRVIQTVMQFLNVFERTCKEVKAKREAERREPCSKGGPQVAEPEQAPESSSGGASEPTAERSSGGAVGSVRQPLESTGPPSRPSASHESATGQASNKGETENVNRDSVSSNSCASHNVRADQIAERECRSDGQSFASVKTLLEGKLKFAVREQGSLHKSEKPAQATANTPRPSVGPLNTADSSNGVRVGRQQDTKTNSDPANSIAKTPAASKLEPGSHSSPEEGKAPFQGESNSLENATASKNDRQDILPYSIASSSSVQSETSAFHQEQLRERHDTQQNSQDSTSSNFARNKAALESSLGAIFGARAR
uniref:Formin-like protein n=1 Tax=Tetraselmis sp. GSL018 TaxID=582737 RepID=A0A061RHT2_9CHLO